MPFLAHGKVRFVGEIIAAVVAPSRYIAEDIVDLIEVDYETLPAYNDVEDAMQPDAEKLHEELDSNIYYADSFSNGDVDKAFAEADLVVSEKITTGRTSAAPMETRGVMATWGWDDTLTVWSSTQMPYPLRTSISVGGPTSPRAMLGESPAQEAKQALVVTRPLRDRHQIHHRTAGLGFREGHLPLPLRAIQSR